MLSVVKVYKRAVKSIKAPLFIYWGKFISALKMEVCGDSVCFAAASPVVMLQPDYSLYKDRLASFSNWKYDFIVNKVQLARCGFYYKGVEDAVHCHKCKIILRRWSVFDSVYAEHEKYSPDCLYLRQTVK